MCWARRDKGKQREQGADKGGTRENKESRERTMREQGKTQRAGSGQGGDKGKQREQGADKEGTRENKESRKESRERTRRGQGKTKRAGSGQRGDKGKQRDEPGWAGLWTGLGRAGLGRAGL